MPETKRTSELAETQDEPDAPPTAAAEEAQEDRVSNPNVNPDAEVGDVVPPADSADSKAVATKKPAPKRAKDPMKPEFLAEQRTLLLQERSNYTRQAEELKAEADSLALEHEPGDVQFDEEGGEGGTSNVDRELDLVLSAQARGAVVEIDRALAKIDTGNYGTCEQCGQPIPQARLKALPYAALCVGCKSGGLSRR
jgi:DnaK suppressor protein